MLVSILYKGTTAHYLPTYLLVAHTYRAQGQQLLAAALEPNAALAGEAGAPQAGARLAALVKATEGYRREAAEACAH